MHKLRRYLLICLRMDGNMAPWVWDQCSHREICTQKGPVLVVSCSVVLVIRYSSYTFSLNLHVINQLQMKMSMLQGLRTWALPPMASASSEWLLILLSLCSQSLFTPPALLSSSCHYCCHLPPRAESTLGWESTSHHQHLPQVEHPNTGALRVKAEPTPWPFGQSEAMAVLATPSAGEQSGGI